MFLIEHSKAGLVTHVINGIELPYDRNTSANTHLQTESLLIYLIPTHCSIRSLRPGMVSNINE